MISRPGSFEIVEGDEVLSEKVDGMGLFRSSLPADVDIYDCGRVDETKFDTGTVACRNELIMQISVSSALTVFHDGQFWVGLANGSTPTIDLHPAQKVLPSCMNSGMLAWMMPSRCWMGSLRVSRYLG